MNNRGITKENLLLIMPPALTRDPSIMALAAADAEALAARLAEIDRVRIISNIDGLDEAVLDILARDFKVDWWDPEYSVDEKRRTLKCSWKVHKILGTKAAVETAISAIYPNTTVEEWFEYGGKPYHFKLSIDLTDTFGDETRPWRVLERVNFYKSLRSHLDEIVFTMTTKPSTLRVGGRFGSIVSMGVPAAEDRFNFQKSVYAGGSFGADQSIGIPDGSDDFNFQRTLHAGGKFTSHTAIPIPEDSAQLPATTILRTGGVCTIISNLSKGE